MLTRFSKPHIIELPRDDWPEGLLTKIPAGLPVKDSVAIRVAGLPTVLHTVTNHDTDSVVKRWKLRCAVRVAEGPQAHVFESSTRFVPGDTEEDITNEFMHIVLSFTINALEEEIDEMEGDDE